MRRAARLVPDGTKTREVVRDAAIDARLCTTGWTYVAGLDDGYVGDYEVVPFRSIDAPSYMPTGGMEVHGASSMMGMVRRLG